MPDDPATPPASASPEHPGDAAARTFTGRQRRRQTRRSVIIADYVAAAIITAGGIGVVLAFGVIVVYLVWVAMPLLWPASVAHTYTTDLPALAERPEESSDAAEAMPVATAIDDNRVAFWMLDEQGQLSLYRAAAAELVEVRQLSDRPVTAISSDRDLVAIGRDDGTIQFGQISFRTQFLREVPDNLDLATSRPGDTIIHDGGVAELLDDGQVRLTRVHVEISDPAAAGGVEEPSPILRIDYVVSANVEAVVALREDGQLLYDLIRKRRDMRTGRVAAELISNELPLGRRAGEDLPRATFMGRNGTMVYVLYPDGHLTRYNTRDAANARIVEEIDLLPAGADVSAAEMLLGDITLIVADQKGGISGWFPAPYPEGYDGPTNPDGLRMVRAHEFEGDGNPITAIGLSGRDRQFLTGDSAGNVALRHMTSATTQGRAAVADGVSIRLLAMAPQANAMLVVDERRRVSFFAIDNPHPEGKLVALFKPIHYEGRTGPEHFWQSTAGTDDVEPKLGLAPLIFGTLKATVYALCFAIPIAILAAIYSSEFMNGHVRTVVKPTVELMAGLPSVVLGFIAALVFAPFVENVVPAVLLLFVSIPLGVMLFGFIWQLVPPQSTQQFGPPLVAGLYLLLGLGLLWGLGPSAGWLATYGAIAALLAWYSRTSPFWTTTAPASASKAAA